MRPILAAFALAAAAAACRGEDAEELEYQRRWKSAASSVARLQRFAARWCADNGLEGAATNEWEASLELEPDNEDARKALGFRRVKGEWTRDEGFALERENRGEPKAVEEALDTYRKKRAGIVTAAERELVPLAKWAADRGFKERARRLWGLVRTFDPDNADACEAVGWKKAGARWFPPDEAAQRTAALALLENGDGGKASKQASKLTEPMEAKFERRRSGHFTFEGRATQDQLAEWLRGAEAARSILFELLAPDEGTKAGSATGVFLTSQAEHVKFLEKCTPLSEDERHTHESLGGWASAGPDIAWEIWTRGELPEYHREAAIHISVHLLFQHTWSLAKPPAWLNEGLALWFTDRLTGSALARCTDLKGNTMGDDRSPSTAGWRARLRARLREATAPRLRAVFRSHADDLDLDRMIVAWSFVSWLATQPEAFRKFVRSLSGGEEPVDALFEALGVDSYEVLQSRWEAWARENI